VMSRLWRARRALSGAKPGCGKAEGAVA